MGDLRLQTQAYALGGGEFEVRLSRDWAIWGPNGGYTSAVILRAIGAYAGKGIPASFFCHYLRVPEFGIATVKVGVLKQGGKLAAYSAQLVQVGKTVAQAQAWLCDPGEGLEHTLRRSSNWLPLSSAGARPPAGDMPCWRNLEIREVKTRDGNYSHWYRFNPVPDVSNPFVDAARSLILIDCMQWPACYYMESQRPLYVAPSLDLYVQFHRFNPNSEWLFCDAESNTAHAGLVAGSAKVWDETGNLIASGGSQSVLRKVASAY